MLSAIMLSLYLLLRPAAGGYTSGGWGLRAERPTGGDGNNHSQNNGRLGMHGGKLLVWLFAASFSRLQDGTIACA